MVYTSKGIFPVKGDDKPYIFLAGSMDLDMVLPWRQEFINSFFETYNFLDPTNRLHGSLTNAQMKSHIIWELEALELADIVVLNLLPKAKSPISLVELGLYAKSRKLVVICPEDFYQNHYVKTLCEYYKVPLYRSLDIFMLNLRKKDAKYFLKRNT